MQRRLKALHMPDYRSGNPYQRELACALKDYGVEVAFPRKGRLLSVLRAVMRHGKPQVLHLHWTHPFLLGSFWLMTVVKGTSFLVELVGLKLAGVRVVWTVHNLVAHERRHARIELLFNGLIARLCGAVVVHCAAAAEQLVSTYRLPARTKGKVHVIPHPAYRSAYPNAISQAGARDKLGLGHDELVFLHVGLIRDYKGVPELIHAFSQLDLPNARLVIAGRPRTKELHDYIAAYAQQDRRVLSRLEFVPDDELQVYLNAADAIVLPYKDILTSGTALLAMSFGKAIIAPRIGCIPEDVGEEGGILYDPSDDTALLTALRMAATADLAAKGQRNSKVAAAKTWDKAASLTLVAYGMSGS